MRPTSTYVMMIAQFRGNMGDSAVYWIYTLMDLEAEDDNKEKYQQEEEGEVGAKKRRRISMKEDWEQGGEGGEEVHNI